jgi:hypothetical protein
MEAYLGLDVGSGEDIQPLIVFQGKVAVTCGEKAQVVKG